MSVDESIVRDMIGGGETFTVEFKRATPRTALSDADIVEAVMCLANGDGGWLLLGVEDSGEITGMAPRHQDRTDAARVAALVLNQTEPPVVVRVQVVTLDGRDVGVIAVDKAVSLVGTKSGLYRRRSVRIDGRPECVPYRPYELLSTALMLAGRDYAETVLPDVSIDDLSLAEFDRFRSHAAVAGGDTVLARASDTDILRALRLVAPDGALTLGAVLLFGLPASLVRWVPTAECLFQVVSSTGAPTVNEALRLPLLAAADALYDRLAARNSEQEVMMGLLRVAVPAFPGRVARESVANALIHRDYSELGPIQVALSDTALRVSSPGGFPPGITLRNMLTESRPRSPILAEAFRRAGVVDRTGRGLAEVFTAVLRTGRPEPDYGLSTEAGVTVAIPTAGADLDLVRAIHQFEDTAAQPLGLVQLRVLSHLRLAGPSSTAELAADLRLEAGGLRIELGRLVETGLVVSRGSGRSRRYHLGAGFYSAAHDGAAYPRVVGADRATQELLILDYVRTHGRISRSQAAGLCLTDPATAGALLRDLRTAGRLVLHGERRGAYYQLASA